MYYLEFTSLWSFTSPRERGYHYFRKNVQGTTTTPPDPVIIAGYIVQVKSIIRVDSIIVHYLKSLSFAEKRRFFSYVRKNVQGSSATPLDTKIRVDYILPADSMISVDSIISVPPQREDGYSQTR